MRQFAGRKALWDAAVDCMAQLDALMSLVGGMQALRSCCAPAMPCGLPLLIACDVAWVRLSCIRMLPPSAGGGGGLRQRHHVPPQAGALEPRW